jgi:hypothetical protein
MLGTLACLDGYMNIALENTQEYVDGRLKNSYGDTFIRGNNGIKKKKKKKKKHFDTIISDRYFNGCY